MNSWIFAWKWIKTVKRSLSLLISLLLYAGKGRKTLKSSFSWRQMIWFLPVLELTFAPINQPPHALVGDACCALVTGKETFLKTPSAVWNLTLPLVVSEQVEVKHFAQGHLQWLMMMMEVCAVHSWWTGESLITSIAQSSSTCVSSSARCVLFLLLSLTFAWIAVSTCGDSFWKQLSEKVPAPWGFTVCLECTLHRNYYPAAHEYGIVAVISFYIYL